MQTFESLPFYRGVSVKHPLDRAIIVTPRKDRRPRDTNIQLHTEADNWFLQNFGVAYRSQAVFVTPQIHIARGYAATPNHVVRVIPLSSYTFCWSRKIADMLTLCMNPADTRPIACKLHGSEYIESNLADAHHSGNEVMLKCDSYISIPLGLLTNPGANILTPSPIII